MIRMQWIPEQVSWSFDPDAFECLKTPTPVPGAPDIAPGIEAVIGRLAVWIDQRHWKTATGARLNLGGRTFLPQAISRACNWLDGKPGRLIVTKPMRIALVQGRTLTLDFHRP